MILNFLAPLGNHLWQSTLFAIAAAILTLALRKNRAQVRYGLWLAASVKFLIPFSLLIAAGGYLRPAGEGTNISAWIREAILARLSAAQRVNTDPILLAELMAIRALILNLFAAASKGSLTDESLRKMQAYADSVKQQKADEFLTKLRAGSGAKPPAGTP